MCRRWAGEQRVRLQMSRKNRAPLADRVAKAAEAALAARHFVSALDILVGIGWLEAQAAERWRRGQIDCLEEAVRANLPRISEACGYSGLGRPRKDCSQARQPMSAARRGARRCASAEASYRIHWMSLELSDKKRERLAEKASHALELVVVQPLNTEWRCHRCGGTGDLLTMETPGPACLRCAMRLRSGAPSCSIAD
jgi:hypothetical protein